MTIHLAPPLPTGSSCQPGPLGSGIPAGDIPKDHIPREAPIWHCSRWGLPCQSCCQSCGGLLPHRFTLTISRNGGLVLCGAFPRVSPAGRYPAPCLVEPGLSSIHALRRCRGHPAIRMWRVPNPPPARGQPDSGRQDHASSPRHARRTAPAPKGGSAGGSPAAPDPRTDPDHSRRPPHRAGSPYHR